jgi:hypothetical protein
LTSNGAGDRRLGRRNGNARAPRAPETARCLRCQRVFEVRRPGHVYCSRTCRYAADFADFRPGDPIVVERLFDEDRDPNERVREDDWHPGPFPELDASDALESRRRWYATLRVLGRV